MDKTTFNKQLEFLYDLVNTKLKSEDRKLGIKLMTDIINYLKEQNESNKDYEKLKNEYFEVLEMLPPRKLVELQKRRFK